MMLQFEDPAKLRTKEVVFEDAYAARDSATLEQLKELSSKRRVLEGSINESSSITEAIAREMSGGLTSLCQQDIQKVEQYLPLLENLVFYVDLNSSSNSQIGRQTSNLKIRWSSALSASSLFNIRGSKFFQINNLQFELGMTLFFYGAVLRNRALEVMPSDLVQSATLFREAAGVYHYLAHKVFPTLQPTLSAEKPPEATPSTSTVMSYICLAEAQAVAIRKAEAKGTTKGLLSKLHCGVAELFDEANRVLFAATGDCKDISTRLVDFISCCKMVHELRSLKYLAESLKIDGQIGVGIGVIRDALDNGKKNIAGAEPWKSMLKKEVDDLTNILGKFEHENAFVWHEKIPIKYDLPKPQGSKIVTVIPYKPKRWERELSFKI